MNENYGDYFKVNRKVNVTAILIVLIIAVIGIGYFLFKDEITSYFTKKITKMTILSSTSNEFFDADLKRLALSNDIELSIDYNEDIEIIESINNNSGNYNAIWLSNSIWLNMLNNENIATDVKTMGISPVVLGINKDLVASLGLINKDITNKDLWALISSGKLKFVMSSVTQTNAGASLYLGLVNYIVSEMGGIDKDVLQNEAVVNNVKSFFNGVERVAGSDEYLSEMFLNGNYNAIISYEKSLIDLNKELTSKGKSPLYLMYPTDGVAINDMPLVYINSTKNNKDDYDKLVSILRSNDAKNLLYKSGIRTWYGTNDTSSAIFSSDYGIDTTRYLTALKYPNREIMVEALDLYADNFRKPNHTIFCLDTSASMNDNNGLTELKDAMKYILTKEDAIKDRIQFSSNDKITVIPFNETISNDIVTYNGSNTDTLKYSINRIVAGGETNFYGPLIKALSILKKEDTSNYTTTIVLMTDGQSDKNYYEEFMNYYKNNNLNIPIYSITFGNSNESQLNELASLTNGKVFNGKDGLKQAFKEVRSYN